MCNNQSQKFIEVFSKQSNATTEASFVMSWNIACSKHSPSDCEFVKKNITEVVLVLNLKNKKLQSLIAQIPSLCRYCKVS